MQFKDVIGQEEIKARLIHEVNTGKISHAQLFLGRLGYGGLPLALAFAQYLFCESKTATDSCGVCSSCLKVSDLQHPDLMWSFPVILSKSPTSTGFLSDWREQVKQQPYFELRDWTRIMDPKEKKPVIGTEESQEIIRKLSLKSYEGGYKVMIIWMITSMNQECSNKLLKILEEPPPKTVFLCIAESGDLILPTIRSRTQTIVVPRIDRDDLTRYLRNQNKLGASSIETLVTHAEGDYCRVLESLGENNDYELNRDLFIQLMRVCYKKDVIPMLDWSDEAAALPKESQKHFLVYALHMFRQSMLKNYTDEQLLKLTEEEHAFLKNFARFITGNNLFDFVKTFDDAHYHVDRNVNSKLIFTNLCFKVMRFIHDA
jgi:DNA polymerase III subunit delta'